MSRGASSKDTIAAAATPAGRGAIGIVRVSGDAVRRIARQLLGSVPEPRYATLSDFTGDKGEVIDRGIALFFPSPHSFTGEDVLELQGHGGLVVMDMLLSRVVECGARLALPGEFSERAFLNDRIDLSQAEAIADLIDSVSRKAARSAVKSLQGAFSSRVRELNEAVLNLRMFIEAAIDFPEEEVDFLADGKAAASVSAIRDMLADTVQQAGQGALLREGIALAIAGRPNAGKSSLMNRLTGTDVSIVTASPGTTRDIVDEYIHIDGIPLKVIDTAGIRASQDEAEAEGVRRAKSVIAEADQVLLVVDVARHHDDWREHAGALEQELGATGKTTVVLNKIDLLKETGLVDLQGVVSVSALTGAGIDTLKARIKALAGVDDTGEGTFIARRRHLDALHRAVDHVAAGERQLQAHGAGELLAEELRLCHECLCEITGEFTSDDLLGKIFASFCIGK